MVLEGSRVLAERLMMQKLSEDERIAKAARLILCRKASEQELGILKRLFDDEKKFYSTDSEKAGKRLEVGEYKHEPVKDIASTAALMQVASTLYNMDEAITK